MIGILVKLLLSGINLAYIHVYAIFYSLSLLDSLREPEDSKKVALLKMLVYWIIYIVSGLMLDWTPLGYLIPGIWHMRTIGLILVLNPKTDWKDAIYNQVFDGVQP